MTDRSSHPKIIAVKNQPASYFSRLPVSRRGGTLYSNAVALAAVCLSMHLEAAQNQPRFALEGLDVPAAWQAVNDDVMGGVSTSQVRIAPDGAVVFTGTVSLENNGGFASVRTMPARHDLTGCDAFVIRVRGDGRRYKFAVRTEPGFDRAVYQAVFPTKEGEWVEHRLAFKDFVPTFRGRVLSGEPPLDPAKVSSVGFLISDQQAGDFRLEIAWLKASRPPGQ